MPVDSIARLRPFVGKTTQRSQLLAVRRPLKVEMGKRFYALAALILTCSLQFFLGFLQTQTELRGGYVWTAKPLYAQSWRLVRKRWGVCSKATSRAERIGPIEGIWRSNFTAACLRLSRVVLPGCRLSSCSYECSARILTPGERQVAPPQLF